MLLWNQFQNGSRTTSGNPKRERGTVGEALSKASLAHASGYHGIETTVETTTAHRIEQTAGIGDLLNNRTFEEYPDFPLTTKRPIQFSALVVVTAFWFQ